MRSCADLELPPISTMEEFSALSSTYWALHLHLQNGWVNVLRWNHFNATRWALKDGKISVSERRLLWFLGVSTSIMLLADLIVVIWVNEPLHMLSMYVFLLLHFLPPSRDQWLCSATTPGGATRTPLLQTIVHTPPCSLPLSCCL